MMLKTVKSRAIASSIAGTIVFILLFAFIIGSDDRYSFIEGVAISASGVGIAGVLMGLTMGTMWWIFKGDQK